MGIDFSFIPSYLKKSLSGSIDQTKENRTAEDATKILSGYALFQARWNHMDAKLCEGMADAILHPQSQLNIEVRPIILIFSCFLIAIPFSFL
jgi:hypothetical protein